MKVRSGPLALVAVSSMVRTALAGRRTVNMALPSGVGSAARAGSTTPRARPSSKARQQTKGEHRMGHLLGVIGKGAGRQSEPGHADAGEVLSAETGEVDRGRHVG